MDFIFQYVAASSTALFTGLIGLTLSAIIFFFIARILKGFDFIRDANSAAPEIGLNVQLFAFNLIITVPVISFFSVGVSGLITESGLVVPASVWDALPTPVVVVAAVFLGDFIGYCRHRFEHSSLLWPSHAIHHSDSHMTWTSIERFHPLNRVTTALIDGAFLLILGLPPYAIMVNYLVRHYYGAFIHMDMNMAYGRLGHIFVSPTMHQWHHSREKRAFGSNFATVFTLFDKIFGTFYLPGPCNTPLGVDADMGQGLPGQLAYAFKPSSYQLEPADKQPLAQE